MIKTKFAELQKKTGAPTDAIARATGIDKATLTAWKYDRMKGVKFGTTEKIMEFFDLDSFDDLFELVNETEI